MTESPPVSSCCRETTTIASSDEGTNFHLCSNCLKPCDVEPLDRDLSEGSYLRDTFIKTPMLEKILFVLKSIGILIISILSGIIIFGVFILGTIGFLSIVMLLFVLGAEILRFIF